MKLRELARNFIQFNVGNGFNIHPQLDHWHPDGILYDKFDHRVVYDVGSSLDAKLSTVLEN